jgi:hypothetical protein
VVYPAVWRRMLLFAPCSVCVCVCVRACVRACGTGLISTSASHIHYKNQMPIITYAATLSNELHQCILTHFNNCNFNKAQMVCSLIMVFHTETCRSLFNIDFNENLILFLRLSNCASVGEKL